MLLHGAAYKFWHKCERNHLKCEATKRNNYEQQNDLSNMTTVSKAPHRIEIIRFAWPISLIIQLIALVLKLEGRTKYKLYHVLGEIAKSLFINTAQNGPFLWLPNRKASWATVHHTEHFIIRLGWQKILCNAQIR